MCTTYIFVHVITLVVSITCAFLTTLFQNDMEQYWVRCANCGAHSSPVTSSQVYLTSCGHFSCNHCLSQAPIPKPPSTGYCYDCKKPCAVINLSQKEKLSPDVGFYFQDPGPLLQKMLEVYNFQKIHRQRKYEIEMKQRLIQDIVTIRSIRERSEPYLQFYGKVYEALNVKYGVKPLTQKCEFSPTEIDEFVSEVAKIKHELNKRTRVAREERSDFDCTMADLEYRTPSQSSMCTPRQSPISGQRSIVASMGSAGGSGSGGRGEASSNFRAHVQNEMRSGGGRSTGGGNHSQCSTPAGSVGSKPSPLLNNKRASQQLSTPGTLPCFGHSNPYPNRMRHLSSMRTPSPHGNLTKDQLHLLQASLKPTPTGLNQPANSFHASHMSSTPMGMRPPGTGSIGSGGRSGMNISRSMLSQQRKQSVSCSGTLPCMISSNSPQSEIRSHGCSPMSVGGTPVGLGSKSYYPRSVRQPYRSQSPGCLASHKESSTIMSLDRGIPSGFPGARLARADGSKPSSTSQYGPGSREVQSEMVSRPRFQPHESTVSYLLHPPLQSEERVRLNTDPRKPLSGMFID